MPKYQKSDGECQIVTVFLFNISLNPWKSDSGDQGSRNQEWGLGIGIGDGDRESKILGD